MYPRRCRTEKHFGGRLPPVLSQAWLLLLFLAVGSPFVGSDSAPASVPSALSFPPSQFWYVECGPERRWMTIDLPYREGNDGLWSSFGAQVGTPPQIVRLLPATGQSATWVVLPEGCTQGDPTNCADLRGHEFHINQSSTWSRKGLFELTLDEERRLGYSGNADFGFDTLMLGWPGDGLPTLNQSVIAGIATKDFYTGRLGLDQRLVNFTTLEDSHLSLLQRLSDARRIPSRSWAYTAGSYNHVPKTFGSLTLGGYDTSRFVSNNVSFRFSPDSSKDFVVGIQSITTDTSTAPLLSTGIFSSINSLVSQIWLPLDACQAFERTFGLVWDNATELYLVNDSLHDALTKLNANVTWKLGPSLTGRSIDIVMPYASFDLVNSIKTINSSTRYFPLKQAANDSQYNLGRAFLQNAYLVADYERFNFSVSQALFPDIGTASHIVPILPPSNVTTSTTRKTGSGGLAAGAVAGIVVGVTAVIVAMTVGFGLWYRRRRYQLDAEATEEVTEEEVKEEEFREDVKEEVQRALVPSKAELDAVSTLKVLAEAPGSDRKVELDAEGAARKVELDAEEAARKELPGSAVLVSAKSDVRLSGIPEMPAEPVIQPRTPSSLPPMPPPALNRGDSPVLG